MFDIHWNQFNNKLNVKTIFWYLFSNPLTNAQGSLKIDYRIHQTHEACAFYGEREPPPQKIFPNYFFLSAEFHKSCNLIGSGSGESWLLKNVSSLSGNLLNDLCYYESKNLSLKPLSSTSIISVFNSIWSPEIVLFIANLAMVTALKCSGLSHGFRCVVEKNKNVIHQLRSVRLGKTVPYILGIQDLGHSFSQYGPPGWWITYVYFFCGVSLSAKKKTVNEN